MDKASSWRATKRKMKILSHQ